MIIFPDLGLYGRLGNQMFQIATMKALSLRNNCDIALPHDIYERENDGQLNLLRNFKLGIRTMEKTEITNFKGSYFEEYYDAHISNYNRIARFDAATIDIESNTAIKGFFESERYFIDYKSEIKSCFELVDTIETFGNTYIDNLKRTNKKKIVGLHLRLNDYIHWVKQMLDSDFETAQKFYIEQIIDYVNMIINTYIKDEDYTLLIFCGGNTEQGNSNTREIKWCKSVLPNWKNRVFCEIDDTIKEFSVMTKCDKLILTSRSTLGWWAGYLNKNPDKAIYVPRTVIGPPYDPDFLWPDEFIQV
jgi:Glycosyl transferase family 11